MAPGDNWKQNLSYEKLMGNLRVALKDPNIGTASSPKPVPKPVSSSPINRIGHHLHSSYSPTPTSSPVNMGWDSDSDGEMRYACTTDLTGEIARQKTAKSNGRNISRTMATELDTEAFKNLGIRRGDQADKNQTFVPWKFLIRYADMFVGKTNTPTVRPYFNEEVIFENQVWDFFYLYEPENLDVAPILFVPTCQLEALLRMINQKHDLALTIPSGGHDADFYRSFGWLPTPQPRYLGRTTLDTSSYKLLLNSIPLPDPEDEVLYFSKATKVDRSEFVGILKKVKDSWEGGKGDGKGRSKKNAARRYENRKAWGYATKRVQRYLGLREKAASIKTLGERLSLGEVYSEKLTFDVNSPVQFQPEDDVVFICFDIESYEKIPKLVTEVGYAVLDTRDIRGVAPGEDARNWFAFIKGHHFRVKEYKHYVNRQYIHGCPEYFQFGKSEIVGIEKVGKVCKEIMTPKTACGEYRNVIVVGHDVAQDIDLILTIDIDVYDLPGLVEIMDNQRMQQHRKRFPNPQGLGGVLTGLEIPHIYLHNAGNDAVYTLQSMLAHSIRMRLDSLGKVPRPKPVYSKTPEYVDPVADAGWSTGGEDTDGGDVPPQVDPLAIEKGKVPWPTKTEKNKKPENAEEGGVYH